MAVPTKPFDLSAFKPKVISGPESGGKFIIIYGKGGVGKSTLACHCVDDEASADGQRTRSGYFILPVGRETGHQAMHGRKFETAGKMGLSPVDHLFLHLQYVQQAHEKLGIKALVIDNYSSARQSFEADVILSNPTVGQNNKEVESLADYGFGRGQAMAFAYSTRLVQGISKLTERGVHVILLAHEGRFTVNNPDGSYYKQISINAQDGENTSVRGLLEAEAHHVLYLTSEPKSLVSDKRGMPADKESAASAKKYAKREEIQRLIYTQPMGDFFAKSRADIDPVWVVEDYENPKELLVKRDHPQFKQLFKELLS